MELHDLELEAIKFTEPPTKSQVSNALRDVESFLARLGGIILAEKNPLAKIGDPSIGTLLNATTQIRAAADAFENGPNSSGLAVPQLQAMPGGQRRQ